MAAPRGESAPSEDATCAPPPNGLGRSALDGAQRRTETPAARELAAQLPAHELDPSYVPRRQVPLWSSRWAKVPWPPRARAPDPPRRLQPSDGLPREPTTATGQFVPNAPLSSSLFWHCPGPSSLCQAAKLLTARSAAADSRSAADAEASFAAAAWSQLSWPAARQGQRVLRRSRSGAPSGQQKQPHVLFESASSCSHCHGCAGEASSASVARARACPTVMALSRSRDPSMRSVG